VLSNKPPRPFFVFLPRCLRLLRLSRLLDGGAAHHEGRLRLQRVSMLSSKSPCAAIRRCLVQLLSLIQPSLILQTHTQVENCIQRVGVVSTAGFRIRLDSLAVVLLGNGIFALLRKANGKIVRGVGYVGVLGILAVGQPRSFDGT